jgi:hypothetical protein
MHLLYKQAPRLTTTTQCKPYTPTFFNVWYGNVSRSNHSLTFMCIQGAKLVERRVRKLLYMKIIHEEALSSATLVPTKVVPSLAASSHSFAAKQCLYVTWSFDYACTRNMHNKSTWDPCTLHECHQ